MFKAEGNRDRTCKSCGKKSRAHKGYIAGVNFVCNSDCAYDLTIKARNKAREKKELKARQSQAQYRKDANKKQRERRKEVKPLQEWKDKLQRLVNQFVVHVRDKDKPCCTCGKSSDNVKYDAGHYRTVAAASEIRYELTNIHKQCSVNCNQIGSGMRNEYRDFIVFNYGSEHLDWLDGPHKSLKEQLPNWQDYEAEIIRYRKLLRDNGVTPCQ